MEEILLILTLLRAKNFQGANRNQQYQAKFLDVLRKKKHVLSHIGITAMESTFLCYIFVLPLLLFLIVFPKPHYE